jgi:hypothetical protein
MAVSTDYLSQGVPCLTWVDKMNIMMLNQFFDDYAITIYCFTSARTHLKINIHDFKFA